MDDDNGKELEILDQTIRSLLENTDASQKELLRGIIRIQQMQLPFIYQAANDHKKVISMWGVFRPALAAGAIVLSLITTLFWQIFTGDRIIK